MVLKTIIIGFSTPKRFKLISWLIRCIEGTPYSHSYVSFLEDAIICHANKLGIHSISVSEFSNNNHTLFEFKFNVEDATYRDTLRYCQSFYGCPYGFKQLIGIAIKKIINYLYKKDVCNIFADGSHTQICVEFCAYTLKKIGFEIDQCQAESGDLLWLYDFTKKCCKKN